VGLTVEGGVLPDKADERSQEDKMTQGNQQQEQQQQEQQQRAQGQQQQSPAQMLARALSEIRRVQNMLELNYPDQVNAIRMQREAGDLIWQIIQAMRQQQQQQ
jgi:NTP pyrophosphatase (non-canonical NTP hydrolase)